MRRYFRRIAGSLVSIAEPTNPTLSTPTSPRAMLRTASRSSLTLWSVRIAETEGTRFLLRGAGFAATAEAAPCGGVSPRGRSAALPRRRGSSAGAGDRYFDSYEKRPDSYKQYIGRFDRICLDWNHDSAITRRVPALRAWRRNGFSR